MSKEGTDEAKVFISSTNLFHCRRHLYTSFGGPWADNPIRPHELDVKLTNYKVNPENVSSPRSYCTVPDDYLTNAQIREKLPPVKLNKLSEDVLFYLFYNCPGEVYQLAAACEL
ncbi:hypothetical protein Y032_0068g204 [Ancylostoma ceylanicum]|uniref:NOT2/NOT3/NOT5 C-terminal domain-containing protein n=1 Tax=Ancylostoma ceylanicum TaxID=53326 RepID=A0A016TYM2_9BILA|nr:hypothetical protein Y032_0068g204 [Ancylostoma ceylanicum]